MRRLILLLIILSVGFTKVEAVTLEKAIEIALNQTSRGGMVRGNLEVAEQNYFARKINFYVPEISINGAIPAYSVDQSYGFFGGADKKGIYKTTDLSYNSFIRLNQSLITGGDIVVTANLLSKNSEYPDIQSTDSRFIDEKTRRGFFTFSYVQPLLKPSNSKYNLKNSRDDLELARLTKAEDEAKLKNEVIEAYIGLLKAEIDNQMNSARFEAASLKAEIDSVKQLDGVISEEDLLISASERLDAELTQFESATALEEGKRELAILLDWDISRELKTAEPEAIPRLHENHLSRNGTAWESSVPVLKAEYQYAKAERESDYKSSGHGLTGDLAASYSTGQGTVDQDGFERDIDTKGWEVALNFSLPLWDGGSSGAEVKSARLQAEQARLEYNQAKKEARANIINLINQIDVGYRRLEIFQKQVDLSQNRLDIANTRYRDGQISMIQYLDSKSTYLESRNKLLDELKQYLLNLTELEGQFF